MFPKRLPRPGDTRSAVRARHALLAPDGFVPAPLPGWQGTAGVVLIAPALALGGGAAFAMTLVSPLEGAAAGPAADLPASAIERFVYVLEGELDAVADGRGEATLGAGEFAFLPPGSAHRMAGRGPLRAVLFEARYRAPGASDVADAPRFVAGAASRAPVAPFEGNERLRVRTLLPDDPSFDMAVNIMEFDPGAALPLVETHVNEHGLYMLDGGGIYRLEDAWYPVARGDAIWMGPHCPQWFGALGATPARYLLYKDVHRPALSDGPERAS